MITKVISLFAIWFVFTLPSVAQTMPDPNVKPPAAPTPVPTPVVGLAQIPSLTPTPTPTPTPLADGQGGTTGPTPSGSIEIMAIQQYPGAPSNMVAVTVSSTEDALVRCNVSQQTPGNGDVVVASGASYIEKNKSLSIQMQKAVEIMGVQAFKINCIPRFLSQAGTSTQKTLNAAPRITYQLASRPPAVTVITDSTPWNPSFTLTRPGKLTLVFDDHPPSVNPRFDAKQGSELNQYSLTTPISMADFNPGSYFRYHFEGISDGGDETLADQNTTYLLLKDTNPVLQKAVQLYSKDGIIHIVLGLSRRVDAVLQFPNSQFMLAPSSVSTDRPYIYDFQIPADAEKAIDQKLKAAVQDAGNSASKANPVALLTLRLLNNSAGKTPIVDVTLSVVNVSATQMLSTIASQQKLGLKSDQAQKVAKEALGIQNASTDQEKAAVAFLADMLTKKTDTKDKLISFLTIAGKAAASYYGIPIGAASSAPGVASKKVQPGQ